MVHITSGVSALVCALYLGKRLGYPGEPMKPHSLVLSFIGACLLWVGWFGFNAGSALGASGAGHQRVRGHALRARPRRPWAGCSRSGCRTASRACWAASRARWRAWWPSRRPRGFVKPMPALVIGFAAGVVCYFMVAQVKQKFGYDDSLDAFGVHGAGGTLGAILTGVFATNAVNDALKDCRRTGRCRSAWWTATRRRWSTR